MDKTQDSEQNAARNNVLNNVLNHFDASGQAIMVDVSAKGETVRFAEAGGRIRMKKETLAMIRSGGIQKGDVLGVARIAGIMAVKRTWEWIPLCHPLRIERCTINFVFDEQTDKAETGQTDETGIVTTYELEVRCRVACVGKTGVEMEALTGVTAALLTVYDMCKAVDRGMEIHAVCLWEKTGGNSGVYRRER